MSQTNYAGIDYSLGRSNVDSKTGIHYGVISQNSLMPEAFDDVWTNSRDLSYEYAVSEIKKDIGRLANESELADFLKQTLGFHRCNPTLWAEAIAIQIEPTKLSTDNSPETVESIWSEIEQSFNDYYESGDSHDWLYESDGYKLTNCLSTDVFVLASPYYTFAQFCSPCVPGAGNLDSPCVDGAKTYCLGHDWFEDNKAPYPVFSVETGEQIVAS